MNNTIKQTRNKTQYDYNDNDPEKTLFYENRTVACNYKGPVIALVMVNDTDPIADSVKELVIEVIINDFDGHADVVKLNASFVGVSPANGRNITGINISSCGNIDDDSLHCIGSYDMMFYDPAVTYTVEVYAEDSEGMNHTKNDTFDYSSLVALEMDVSLVAFGNMEVGQEKEIIGDTDWESGTATIKNLGNVVIDAKINATDFVSGGNKFDAEQSYARFGELDYHSLTNNERVESELDLLFGQNVLENIDFKLIIPNGAFPGSYTSKVSVNGVTD